MGVRTCRTCGEELSAGRLAAMPNAVQCVPCLQANGDVEKVAGHMVWDHKTAPVIEIGTDLAQNRPTAHPRQGKGTIGLTNLKFDDISEGAFVTNVRSARCHPERASVTPKGHCAECALDWYVRRRRG